jgi:hypothetical protein
MVALLTCNVSPASSGKELMTSDNLLTNAVARRFEIGIEEVLGGLNQIGDIGELASVYFKQRRGEILSKGYTIKGLLKRLKLIGDTTGEGSKELKEDQLTELLEGCCSADEIKYVIRIIQVGLHFWLDHLKF